MQYPKLKKHFFCAVFFNMTDLQTIERFKKVENAEILTIFSQQNIICFTISEQKTPAFLRGKKYFLCKNLSFDEIIDKFTDPSNQTNYVVECQGSLRNAIRQLLTCFSLRRAAGGVVFNNAGQCLLIQRNGMWDLPKGHVERGETHTFAALREVEEETGARNLHIGKPITKTYHIYKLYDEWILKQTSWYEMHTSAQQHLLPQTEEGITQVLWAAPQKAAQLLNTSYSTMQYLATFLNK